MPTISFGAMMRATFICLAASFALTACVTVAKIDTEFDEAMQQQAAKQLEPGDATIKGEAFLRPGTWRSLKAAGEIITLVPATPYADERMRKIFGAGKFAPANGGTSAPPNEAYWALVRTTKGDHEGKFVFDNIKPGRYYLICLITWRYAGEFVWQGGTVMDVVTVKPGETVKAILSGH